ncbi:MAG: DNA methyltransferase [Lactococcus lactis]|uniref:site-specific DNA-methyltransferase n=1 Tax=Lactococcus lactis TaxID=1358 RepID=UPI00223BA629|nr:site-specific DNA-methyltransferase [Lactococcus lactis]MCT0044827.1 site-specific DNA-methyltransferase [Lactococcus lactis subsp. lactis]
MNENLIEKVKAILQTLGEKYITSSGDFIISKIREDLENLDETLVSKLLEDPQLKLDFTRIVAETTLFDGKKLAEMLSYETYWQGSYTKYVNKIGLTAGGKYLDENLDVVLDFPYKDTVLTANMSKESEKLKELRDEPFLNEIVAKSEIDVLLDKKILVNAMRYYKEHLNGSKALEFDENTDNLIIKGNNLLALHTLKEKYAGKVKLIYLDPPYNTGNDSFLYNDRFNHSTWLTFMKNRLEIAKDLLSEDGSIWVNLDNSESHYFKVLADSIFKRDNFVANIIWQNNKQSKGYTDKISLHHNELMVYRKSENFSLNLLPRQERDNINYKNPDNDPKGAWRSSDVRNSALRPNLQYDITTPKGNIIHHPENGWRFSKETFERELAEGKIKFSDDYLRVIRKIYLCEQEGRVVESVWSTEDSGSTREANAEIKELFGDSEFSTPKPEKLLRQIITISTNENDLVLDFFMGSATTQAVALKMNRRFIGIEQMDYINTVSVERLKKVIEGEQGGISKSVNWQGGGSFVYAELMEKNSGFIREIANAETVPQLQEIYNRMQERGDIDFRVDNQVLAENLVTLKDGLGEKLSFEEIQKLLIRVIDKNQLYYNLSEIDDSQVKELLSEEDVEFNANFYGG